MTTTTTNKLPEFATKPQDNTFDEEIIDKSSELEETGFVPNTIIRSSQMNTYMKMMIESLRGIVDGLYRQASAQGEIKANSTAQDWQNYIQKGLTDLITKTKVNNAIHADEAIKLQNSRTISIAGDATGSASFDGSADATITVDVNHAAALDSKSIGNSTNPVYIDANGKPQATGSSLSKSITGNAGTATKLQTPKNIALTGDVVGNANFDGSSNIEIETSTTLANAKSMVTDTGTLLNAGGLQRPVYFSNGKPTQVDMFRCVGTYQLIRTSTGNFEIPAISDTSYFLAFVEIGVENEDVYLSGLAEFSNGIIKGMMSGNFIANQTGSGSSTAFINTLVFSMRSSKATIVRGQAVTFSGSISANVSYDFIRITKLYQIR